jgi:hypothetical protein
MRQNDQSSHKQMIKYRIAAGFFTTAGADVKWFSCKRKKTLKKIARRKTTSAVQQNSKTLSEFAWICPWIAPPGVCPPGRYVAAKSCAKAASAHNLLLKAASWQHICYGSYRAQTVAAHGCCDCTESVMDQH